MSQPQITTAVNATLLGEGPHWVPERQELLYVDILGKAVHRYIPSTRQDYSLPIEGRPSSIIPIHGQPNKYLVTVEKDICVLEWDGISSKKFDLKKKLSVDKEHHRNRFNDGKCDSLGRFWAGTMGQETTAGGVEPEKGKLFKVGLDWTLSSQVDKLGMSSGLAWSRDSQKFFFVDSVAYTIDVFDFDLSAGTVSNRKLLFDLKKNGIQGLPGGITVDADNNLWVAVFMGGKVLNIDSTEGKVKNTINFERRASRITSVSWGGPDLDILYVTSAKFGLTPQQLKGESDPGALFTVTNVGSKGTQGGVPFKGKLGS